MEKQRGWLSRELARHGDIGKNFEQCVKGFIAASKAKRPKSKQYPSKKKPQVISMHNRKVKPQLKTDRPFETLSQALIHYQREGMSFEDALKRTKSHKDLVKSWYKKIQQTSGGPEA